MFMLSNLILPEPESKADQLASDGHYYRGILHGLIDKAARLADMVEQEAKAKVDAMAPESKATPAPDATVALERIARTVRRCIMLARKICEPVRALPSVDAAKSRVAARKKVIRRVEDAIYREAAADEADALRAELAERMEMPEFEDDLDVQPLDEIILEMEADLGVAGAAFQATRARRTPQDIAALCARAAALRRPASGPPVLEAMPDGAGDARIRKP